MSEPREPIAKEMMRAALEHDLRNKAGDAMSAEQREELTDEQIETIAMQATMARVFDIGADPNTPRQPPGSVAWRRIFVRAIEAALAHTAEPPINAAAQEHDRMPSAGGGTGVGQTDDGALTSGPGMRARNAEGSPPVAAAPNEPVASDWSFDYFQDPLTGEMVRYPLAERASPQAVPYNRAREMAEEVMNELRLSEHGWNEDDVERIQSTLLPRVYDCLNLLAMAAPQAVDAPVAPALSVVEERKRFDCWYDDPPDDGPTPEGPISRESAWWIWSAALASPVLPEAPKAPEPSQMCLPNGLPFDAFGEPRTRYVRVSLDGNHCVMHPSEGDRYLQDARDNGDESAYVVADVYLSEREFDDLPEHDGF
jgi:hypothetical protein